MARDLGYVEIFLTNAGVNAIVDEVMELNGLSQDEQLRRAAHMGFIAAGGASRILSDETGESVVEIFVRDSMFHMDSDELDAEELDDEQDYGLHVTYWVGDEEHLLTGQDDTVIPQGALRHRTIPTEIEEQR